MHSHRIVQVGRDFLNHLVQTPGSSRISRSCLPRTIPIKFISTKGLQSLPGQPILVFHHPHRKRVFLRSHSILHFLICLFLSFVLSVALPREVWLLNSSLSLFSYWCTLRFPHQPSLLLAAPQLSQPLLI